MLKRIAFVLAAILLLAIVEDIVSSLAFPCNPQSQTQEKTQRPEKCPGFAQSVSYRAIGAVVDWIDSRHDFIIAASTLTIAGFTATLWWATKKTLEHSRQVERAYVAGSVQIEWYKITPPTTGYFAGRIMEEPPRLLTIILDNNGKTAAFVTDIAAVICDANELPEIPDYSKSNRLANISMSPGATGVLTQFSYDFATVGGKIIYGRIYYTDIYNCLHSSGFIRQILSSTTGAIHAAPEYTTWD